MIIILRGSFDLECVMIRLSKGPQKIIKACKPFIFVSI